MTILSHSTPTVLITESDRQTALRFAQQQPTREKASQVYRNTIAVLAAQHCLDRLEIPTDLTESDSWNPFCQLAADVADLPVTGLGHLECRPIHSNEQTCTVPVEALEDRIGYLVVQVEPAYQEATILGFSPNVTTQSLALKQLQPLEELLIYLDWLQAQSLQRVTPSLRPIHYLSRWLTTMMDVEDSVWQTVENLWRRLPEPTFAFRSLNNIVLDSPSQIQQLVEQLHASQQFGSLHPKMTPIATNENFLAALVHLIQTTPDEETRWKAAEILWTIDPGNPVSGVRRVLDLGLLLAKQPLALMVAILQLPNEVTSKNRLSILARVYPMAEQTCLPTGLQLAVLDETGQLGLETVARERDNYIQLKLRGEFGEHFSIRLTLEDDVMTESFVI